MQFMVPTHSDERFHVKARLIQELDKIIMSNVSLLDYYQGCRPFGLMKGGCLPNREGLLTAYNCIEVNPLGD